MALTLNPEWGDMLYKSPKGATCVSMLDKTLGKSYAAPLGA